MSNRYMAGSIYKEYIIVCYLYCVAVAVAVVIE
jgi:hypothetical protein